MESGWGLSKDTDTELTHTVKCRGAACHENAFLSVSFETHTAPDALLPAKRVWILESPSAHLAVVAHRPVAERKDKIDFSLHRHVLSVTPTSPPLPWLL